MEFDKTKYDIEYHKKYKSQFKVDLSKEENQELTALLKEKNMKKVEFVRWAIEKLKQEKKLDK